MTYVTTADRMLIGGQLVHSSNGEFDYSINPATEETIGRSPRAAKQDVERAVQAAEAAWPAWAALAPLARGAKMREFGDALRKRAEEILHVEVADTGNTVTPMRGDVGGSAFCAISARIMADSGLVSGGFTITAFPAAKAAAVRATANMSG